MENLIYGRAVLPNNPPPVIWGEVGAAGGWGRGRSSRPLGGMVGASRPHGGRVRDAEDGVDRFPLAVPELIQYVEDNTELDVRLSGEDRTLRQLAGITLLVISVMLVRFGRPSRYTLTPMVFITGMAFMSALYQLWALYSTGKYFLVFVDLVIIVAAIFVMLEAISAFKTAKSEPLQASATNA